MSLRSREPTNEGDSPQDPGGKKRENHILAGPDRRSGKRYGVRFVATEHGDNPEEVGTVIQDELPLEVGKVDDDGAVGRLPQDLSLAVFPKLSSGGEEHPP